LLAGLLLLRKRNQRLQDRQGGDKLQHDS
jgi:hypothetical protein